MAKSAPSTIETHESSSIADALLLSLTLGDEVWDVLWDCGFMMLIQRHTKHMPLQGLFFFLKIASPSSGQIGKKAAMKTSNTIWLKRTDNQALQAFCCCNCVFV